MPQFNPWLGSVGIHGNRLESMYKHPKQRIQELNREILSDIAYGAGGIIGGAVSEGARRFGQWYYPSEKVVVKNNLLTTNKAMPYKRSSTTRKAYRKRSKKATNRKNSKKRFTKKRKSMSKITRTLTKQVKTLQKAVNVDKAKHTFKSAEAFDLKALIGRCNHAIYNGVTKGTLETASANLRYYDPAVPATLVTADANTGSYSRDIHFKRFTAKLNIRNNYQVPCRVKVYLLKPKVDSNDSPITTYTNGLADQVINAGVDETDALMYINDIERMKEIWKIDCVLDIGLEPGQETATSHTVGPINFDPAHIDDHSNAYQKVLKSFVYVIRVEGVVGHDTAADEQTLLLSGIDIQGFRKAEIEYDAGVALNDIYMVDYRAQSFTNGGVCSLKPVADNIAYSVS